MHIISLIRRVSCVLLVTALPMLGACSRVVSVAPLADGLPPSAQNWDGAYVAELGDAKGKMSILLQMKRRGDGAYDFTLHTRGPRQDLFAGTEPLDLMGHGEVRLVDVGENFVAAQTRCEIGFLMNAEVADKSRTLVDMVDVTRRFGAMSTTLPRSNILGPYVYAFVRGTPARAETILAVSNESVVTEAAAGTSIDVDKWETGVGDSLLLGAGMIFEADDVHIANHGAPGEARTFFAHLARKTFDSNGKDAMVWTRVPPERLSTLRFSDRYPGRGRLPGWCNLMAGVPSN